MPFDPTNRSWYQKFADAFWGLALGVRGQGSFVAHIVCAAVVVCAAAYLGANAAEWLVLVLCITLVLTAEMINSALERLAKAIDQEENPHLRDGLNIASAAALIAAIGTAAVGTIVFLPKLIKLFSA